MMILNINMFPCDVRNIEILLYKTKKMYLYNIVRI